jgi:hypothetical protein
MIGIIAGEGWTRFECYPVIGSSKGFDFWLPNFTRDNMSGEWGVAISDSWIIWVYSGQDTSFHRTFWSKRI